MKKFITPVMAALVVLVLLSACFHSHDICISTSEDEEDYEMDASFHRNKSHAIQVYLNEHLINNRTSFKNWNDEEITLDDETTFYIDSSPGQLRIRIDKAKNSEESYEKVRRACEELKEILADN